MFHALCPSDCAALPRLRKAGRGRPRLPRNVPSPSYSVWNTPRRCNSGTSHSKASIAGSGRNAGMMFQPSQPPPSNQSCMTSAMSAGVPIATLWPCAPAMIL